VKPVKKQGDDEEIVGAFVDESRDDDQQKLPVRALWRGGAGKRNGDWYLVD